MATPATRFESFNIHSTAYKRIGSHEISVSVLIPKTIRPGPSPLLAKFHGGGLVLGDALFPDWFAAYFVSFTHRNNAVIVTPNYRLLPESNGADILQDIADFWKWFRNDLPTFVASVAPDVQLDYEHLLLSGESAGGFIALLSSIQRQKHGIHPRAVLVEYPMTQNIGHRPNTVFGQPVPGPEIVDQHLASIKPGIVFSSSRPDAVEENRVPLLLSLIAHDRLRDFYGMDKSYWPYSAIEDEGCEGLVPTTIIHGEQDSLVPVSGSREFVSKVEKLWGEEGKKNVRLVVRDGEHGFDTELTEEQTQWLKEELQWVEGKWNA
jgi:acetyl esterase/lipase